MDTLKRERGSIKARLTHFTKHIDSLSRQLHEGSVLTGEDLLQLEGRESRAETLLDEFHAVQTKIENSVEENQLDEQYVERETFEDSYHSVLARARRILRDFTAEVDDNQSVVSAASVANSVQYNQSPIKLQPISLPTYSGSYHNWLEFRNLFKSLVHQNAALDNIQKFHYLRSSLEGSAAQVIKSLEFTNENYPVAWDLLCQRYDNKRLLIDNHVKSLFNIEPLIKESSYKIRQLIDTFSKHLRSLQSLDQPTDKWDTLLIFMITSKLDPVTSREWENYRSKSDIPSLDDLQTFLKARADLLETIEMRQSDKKHFSSKTTN